MNLLDENIREDQRGLLQRWGIPVHQIGVDVGRKGMQDEEIIPFCIRSAIRPSSRAIWVSATANFAIRNTAWFVLPWEKMKSLSSSAASYDIQKLIQSQSAWAQ